MIAMSAIVIYVEGNEAFVESRQGGGCGNCSSANGCGSGKLSQLFCSTPRRYRVRNDTDAKVGELVQIGVEKGVLLQSAILMYMLPLVLLLVGAIAGEQLLNDALNRDAYSALAGFVGLFLGFILVKFISLSGHFSMLAQPVILPSPV